MQLRLENRFQIQQELLPLRLLAQCQTEPICALPGGDRGQDLPRLPVQRIVQKQRCTKPGGCRLILHGLLPSTIAAAIRPVAAWNSRPLQPFQPAEAACIRYVYIRLAGRIHIAA